MTNINTPADLTNAGDRSAATARCEVGHRCREIGDLVRAEECYREALRIDSSHAGATHFLGMLLAETGRSDDGLRLMRESIASEPNVATFRLNLGAVCTRRGMFAEAISHLRESARLQPELVEAHLNLGLLLEGMGQLDEAGAAYARAAELRPQAADLSAHRARALARAGRPLPIAMIPERPAGDVWFGALDAVALAHERQGHFRDAIATRTRQISVKRDPAAHSALVRLLLFDPSVTAEQLHGAHRRWGNLHACAVAPFRRARPTNRSGSPNQLRVGLMSPHFASHPVARFIAPWLLHHDRARFHVTCYSDRLMPDQTTARLRGESDAWGDTAKATDEQLAELIVDDGIDVLVDLTGHMTPNRLMVIARRPASVQLSYLYPHSPGTDAFDGRLTDAWADPPGAADQFSVERLIRLPGTAWCYRPPDEGPDICDPPSLSTGAITFGSLNQCIKINPAVVECWARILHAVPRSRLMLLVESGPSTDELRSAFETHAIEGARIQPVARRSHREYLDATCAIDIALDPFPFNGHTTTYDMLWMGLPVVTLAGATPQARVGIGLLNNLGAPEWVASSMDEYVSIAAGLANDPAGLRSIRQTLRERMRASILMDEAGFTRRVEDAIWNLGRRV